MSDSSVPAAMPAAAASAPAAKPSALNSIEAQTRVELVRIAFDQLQAGAAIGTVGVAAFAFLAWAEAPAGPFFGWQGFMVLTLGWALWIADRFSGLAPADAAHPRWGLYLIASSTLTAAGWGATPWIFPFLTQPGYMRTAHLLLMAGIAVASGRVLLSMHKGGLASLIATMLPIALCYVVRPEPSGHIIAIFVSLFTAHGIWATHHNHRTLSDAIVARFEREAVTAELHREIHRREAREAELLDARQRAEAASRAKGDFLATISHEIRTPMNGVLGMLRIVRDTDLTPTQQGYLRTASESADALLLLLNDVLDFSKIEANRLDLEHTPFSPATVARSVADLYHERARHRHLQFNLRLGDNLPPTIVGDAGRVRQILVNLVGNAIKFTERGRVEFSVTCPDRQARRATLHFDVTDTGIGIEPAALERLFAPFTQADNSMSRRYGGTGLGLAISQRLTQAMGGALQVQSAPGQGSTFRLVLPADIPESVTPTTRADAPARFVAPRLKGHILVVEDDSVNQQVIELFLKKLNLSLKFAGDGETAIRVATTEHFDLVLMDCQLPGIDGVEATRQIRLELKERPLRIVALTANVSSQFRETCLAAGMDDYLAKPVRFELLASTLQRHLPAAG